MSVTKIFLYIGGVYALYYAGNIIYDLYMSGKSGDAANGSHDEIIEVPMAGFFSEEPAMAEDVYAGSYKEDAGAFQEQPLKDEVTSHSVSTSDPVIVSQERIQEDVEKTITNVTVHGGYSVNKMQSLIKNAINNPEENPFVGLSQF